ncbi:acyl-CoA carboxylase subunit epsilon [Streptomyces sp. NPDC058751]|uniref:acyl-CoA carboxylase subunit epsilon n=1 Tax=Streptomyces sp. NPDC058751 TaxID=3346623 RepID=UPI0036D1B388
MDPSTPRSAGALRVHRGHADPEDLAALMAVLHARAAAFDAEPRPPADGVHPAAGWHRPERHTPYTDPRSWHSPRP